MVPSPTEKVSTAASTAADKAQGVAGSAKGAASDLAGTAKDQLAQVSDEVAQQAKGLIDEATGRLRQEADNQAERLESNLRSWSSQMRALSEGRPEEAGDARQFLSQVAGRVDGAADQLHQRGLEGLAQDVQDFARRRPAAFLAGATVVGFVIGRVMRGAQAARQQEAPGRKPAEMGYGPAPMAISPPSATRPSGGDRERASAATVGGELP